jgi:hypothetical protein
VQKPPGDAAVSRFIQQAIPRIGDRSSTLLLLVHLSRLLQKTSQTRETKNRAYEITARRSLHAGKDPNEVRWKNLLRYLRIPLPAGKSNFISYAGAGEGI